MRKSLFLLVFVSGFASANPIDDNCSQLTYKQAPTTSHADTYICHKEYAVAFSYRTKLPVYTTEYLSADHTGSLPRTNDFKVDPSLPAQYQYSPHDYVGQQCNGNRCDKGHMTPDQDFSSCEVCVHESFYMTNMVPQNANNNEQIWKRMEMQFRQRAKAAPIYVITGPVFNSDKIAPSKGLLVPDELFKIAILRDGHSIAYMMPNKALPVADLEKYRSSISAIEKATGIKFNQTLESEDGH